MGYPGKVLLTNPAKVTSNTASSKRNTLPVDHKDLRGGVHTVPHISNNLSLNPAGCLKINLDTNFLVEGDAEKPYRQCGRVNPITQFLFVTEVRGLA